MSKKKTKKTKVEKSGVEKITAMSEEVQGKSEEELKKTEKEQQKQEEKQEEKQGEPENTQGISGEIQQESEKKPEETGAAQEEAESAVEASEPEESETKEKTKKPGGKAKWVVLGIVLILLISVSGGYAGMAMYYRTHFFPGSTVNGMDCSNMEAVEIAELVDAQINTYCLQVLGRDHATGESAALIGEIVPGDISLSYIDSLGGVESILAEQDEWKWVQAYIAWNLNGQSLYDYSLVQGVQFDEDKLKGTVNGWAACIKKNMQKPQDAYISEYSDEISGYQVIPETIGTELDLDKVLNCISSAIYAKQDAVDLEQELCYIGAKITQTDARLTDLVETANTWLGTEITYDWNGNEVVLDIETLKDWIVMEEDGPTLDEEAVKSFVKAQAKNYNTYGKKKKFVTALGVELTLDSPNYGWRTDTEAETEELIQLIYQGSVTDREPVYSVTAREKGSEDIGSDYIEADLTHQHLYVHEAGQIVFETDFVSGMTNIVPSRATPAGIFGLTYKTRNATLRGADYASFVNYWMPFYGNYGMHDATWRRDFGGTIYQSHGSHGCINLPLASAEVIYDYVSTGFPVICYYYEVDPLEPPAETQMPSEEELQAQEEPVIGQGTEEPGESIP
ncbi:MAG: L,D-transpeptidase/peptidoglycan binding protein [Acetatifactor sp.]|nr:L,D-transpeptidase/peptidoglycan binding protein [Acetatifactor sp.]